MHEVFGGSGVSMKDADYLFNFAWVIAIWAE